MPPTAGTVVVTASNTASYRNVHVKSNTGMLSEMRLNAPAAICIVCRPCVTTGVLLKWKVMVRLPLDKAKLFAGVPLTEKSLAWTVAGSTASDRLITKSVG